MARPTKQLNLTLEQKQLLEKIARSRETPHSLVQRTQIVLKAAAGINNKMISLDLGLCEDTVGMWRKRWLEGSPDLVRLEGKSLKLRERVGLLLADKPRPGSPGKFSAEQICQIIALACETPPEHLSHWTRQSLARETIQRGIAENISPTSIGRFLKSGLIEATSSQILVESLCRR